MQLDTRIRELIALGSAVGANCHPCLEYHLAKARREAIPEGEIAAAIDLGKMVRKGAQGKMDALVATLLARAQPSPTATGATCCTG